MFFLLSLFVCSLSYQFYEPNPGYSCNGTDGSAGIQYYVDPDTNEVFPFYYYGCGGDENHYSNREIALTQVNHSHFACPGYPNPYGFCDYYYKTHPLPKLPPGAVSLFVISSCQSWNDCYKDTTDKNSIFDGVCCNSTVAEEAKENAKAPECSYTLPPVTYLNSNGYEAILLSRNCSNNFCPKKSVCHQGEFYAYCCQSDPIDSTSLQNILKPGPVKLQ